MDTRSPRQYENLPVDQRRHDTIVPEAGADPYRDAGDWAAGTVCARCGLVFEDGRWTQPNSNWAPPVNGSAFPGEGLLCPACRRTRDDYPAGILAARGAFITLHLPEVLDVIRRNSELEIAEHPLNRVMTIETGEQGVELKTTDLHLARRIGESLHDTYGGELQVAYLPEGDQARISWRRDDLPVHEAQAQAPQPLFEAVVHDVEPTPEVLDYLRQRIARLPEFYSRIISSRIVLSGETRHHQHGGPFSVHLHIAVPQRVISVTRQQRGDLHVAIREAFDAAQRQLEDLARKQRGEVSPAVQPLRGGVARVFPALGYGFIESPEGDVYFHRNAVLGGRFDELRPGQGVRYELEAGERGLQASTVALPGD